MKFLWIYYEDIRTGKMRPISKTLALIILSSFLAIISLIFWLINLFLMNPYEGLIGNVRMVGTIEEMIERALVFPSIFTPLFFAIVAMLLAELKSRKKL